MILNGVNDETRIKSKREAVGNGVSGTALMHMSAEKALAYGLIDKIIDKR